MRTPFHVEAYPRLDLQRAHAELRRGNDFVSWHDQDGRLVGVGELSLGQDNNLTISAQFQGINYLPSHRTTCHITCEVFNKAEHVDVLTSCSGCGLKKRKLSLVADKWSCRECSRLSYRSQILSASAAASVRWKKLAALIGRGRPRGMHLSTYERLLSELRRLEHQRQDGELQVPPHQRWQLQEHWNTRPPPLPDVNGLARSSRGAWVGFTGLALLGEPLFAGDSLDEAAKVFVLRQLALVRRQMVPQAKAASRLKVRRAVRDFPRPAVPRLLEEGSLKVAAHGAALIEAQLVVPFEGAGSAFDLRLTAPQPDPLPRALVAGKKLIIAAKFERRYEPFVSELLRAERRRIQLSLDHLQRDADEIAATYQGRVKQLVSDLWPLWD